jgi:hypothetical protein
MIVALSLAALGGQGVVAGRFLFPTALLLLALPMNACKAVLGELPREAHPLRSVSDCAGRVGSAELSAGSTASGIYAIGEQRWFLHSYYYYLRRLGVWDRTDTLDAPALERALFEPGRQRPVMIDDIDYRAFKVDHAETLRAVPVLPLREVLLLLPGPYAVCAPSPMARGPQPH